RRPLRRRGVVPARGRADGRAARAVARAAAGVTRVLAWNGCVNVRDLGGLQLEGGGETAFRVLVRADDVAGLQPDGWRALADYGVERVVDLRWHDELAQDPPRGLDVETVHVPLFGEAREGAYATKYDGRLDA